jgi:hypothetical protein
MSSNVSPLLLFLDHLIHLWVDACALQGVAKGFLELDFTAEEPF